MQQEPIDVTPVWEGSEEDERQQQPTPRRRRTKAVVLGSLLVVGLAGAGVVGTAGWRILQQKDATLDTPSEVAGLRLDESERARATADYLSTAINARIELDASIGAVYADPASADRSVLVFGGTTLLLSPEKDLDSLFDVLSDDTGEVTGLEEVPAGELGGVMKCGESVESVAARKSGESTPPDSAMTVCGWADHGSVVIAMFPGRGPDDSASLLRTIRGTIQTRS